ncbi:hypothetical protein ACFO6R_12590 [Eubacterium multiforme]|uniref:Uncharacterized protein n=1 Tax=Eubacterium multiforme TaxID=83339 RepID=A0ABT9UWA5_9FIRM|nr:hypothetical protein [Eubacterium multiforme]MDQ0150593.1 hypothetical protein [Eubacterium multiforme]
MKNKRWKRKAKRLIGKSDLFMCECEFCELFNKKIKCYGACTGQYREIEKLLKNKEVRI